MSDKDEFEIFLSPPHQSGKELEYLDRVLKSNWIAPGGQFVKEFESALGGLVNRSHCVALNSGTAALHLALKVLKVNPGDHVICQSFSFVASANPIIYQGAVPVFVDSEMDTWNMDPQLLEDALKDLEHNGIRPKAIIYTHIYGQLAKVQELLQIAAKYEIPIVEDAAEALGSETKGRPAGAFGDLSIISFNGNKVITTAGGGALLCDSEAWSQHARALASQARDRRFPHLHTEVGYNYQMSNLSAAMGLAQLTCLSNWIDCKRTIFKEYHELLMKNDDFTSVEETVGCRFNRWLSVFLAPNELARERVITALRSSNIEARRFWKPLHLLDIYRYQKSYISDCATMLFRHGFCLPSGAGLSRAQQESIKKIISLLY